MDGDTAVYSVGEKTRAAADKSWYTPYLEIKSSKEMENAEPSSKEMKNKAKIKEDNYGLSLQLGEEYEKKKQKLKEELRLDFRRFVAEKKELGAGDFYLQHQIRPVPIRERRSAKAPGRDHFASATPIRPLLSPDLRGLKSSPSPDRPLFSRRDVGKVAEPVIRAVPKPPQRHWQKDPEPWDRRPRRQHSSEDELYSEEEQEVEILQKRRPRNHQEPGRRERRLHYTANRVAQERREVDAPTANEDDFPEENRRTPLATFKTKY